MSIKAIFIDIDGTLRGMVAQQINPIDIEALRKANANGIKIVIATGRDMECHSEASLLDPYLDLFSGYVGSNGQQTFLNNKQELSHYNLDEDDLKSMMRVSQEHQISILYSIKDQTFITNCTDLVIRFNQMIGIEIPAVRTLTEADFPIMKTCMYISLDDEIKYLRPVLRHTQISRCYDEIVDIIPNGIGKEIGTADLAEYFGFTPEECMTIGDGVNDIGMLKWAGIGVAMGSAIDEVKSAANFVTLTSEEAGIAHALKHFHII